MFKKELQVRLVVQGRRIVADLFAAKEGKKQPVVENWVRKKESAAMLVQQSTNTADCPQTLSHNTQGRKPKKQQFAWTCRSRGVSKHVQLGSWPATQTKGRRAGSTGRWDRMSWALQGFCVRNEQKAAVDGVLPRDREGGRPGAPKRKAREEERRGQVG